MPRPSIRDPKKDPRALLGRALKRLRLAAGCTTQAARVARLDGHGEDSVQKAGRPVRHRQRPRHRRYC